MQKRGGGGQRYQLDRAQEREKEELESVWDPRGWQGLQRPHEEESRGGVGDPRLRQCLRSLRQVRALLPLARKEALAEEAPEQSDAKPRGFAATSRCR